jgi:hypothetical protein
MKVHIDFDKKIARVAGLAMLTAGWLGFRFAKQHRDLIDDGWVLEYYEHETELGNRDVISLVSRSAQSGHAEIAGIIHAGPQKCCHKCCH